MKLSLVTLRSRDLDASARFYSCLGHNFVRHAHGGPEHLCAESDDVVFEIYPLLDATMVSSGVRLGFDVDDADATVQRLLDAGGTLERALAPSRFGMRAVVRDLDGHAVEVRQR
jgi:lactoylglutathione lyase